MSAVMSVASEHRAFRRSAAPAGRTTLAQAFEAELIGLGRQVELRGEIEGSIRLRALAEIEAGFSTHDLCRLAAQAE